MDIFLISPDPRVCVENLCDQHLHMQIEATSKVMSKIVREKYEVMLSSLEEVDLSEIIEDEDNTDLAGEAACAGGQCEVKFV